MANVMLNEARQRQVAESSGAISLRFALASEPLSAVMQNCCTVADMCSYYGRAIIIFRCVQRPFAVSF